MIINSICDTCLQSYAILVQASDVELIKQIADDEGLACPCPRLCGGNINLVGGKLLDVQGLRQPISLTGLQLYQAVNGMGLPDEVPTDKLTVDALLRANTVVKCDITEFDGSVYLNEMHLNNGLILHLTAGARGAQVLKITKVTS
jgi:hypothetical protein